MFESYMTMWSFFLTDPWILMGIVIIAGMLTILWRVAGVIPPAATALVLIAMSFFTVIYPPGHQRVLHAAVTASKSAQSASHIIHQLELRGADGSRELSWWQLGKWVDAGRNIDKGRAELAAVFGGDQTIQPITRVQACDLMRRLLSADKAEPEDACVLPHDPTTLADVLRAQSQSG